MSRAVALGHDAVAIDAPDAGQLRELVPQALRW
jgi:hypothetical protein